MMQTQWRVSPLGHRVGLEYTSLPVACQGRDVELSSDLFARLQLLELNYLKVRK